jgi:hypothetical protein
VASLLDLPTSYSTFVEAVVELSASELLSMVATEAGKQVDRYKKDLRSLVTGNVVTPWALVEIARVAILYGIDAGRTPEPLDLHLLCSMYSDLADPIMDGPSASITKFLVRLGNEQFRWQISEFEELSRPHALLVDAAATVPTATLHTEEHWRNALGCSVDEFVAIGFVMFTMAARGRGFVNLDDLATLPYSPLVERYPQALIEDVVRRQFAATRDELRQREREAKAFPESTLEHRFNPLAARPLVWLDGRRFIAPHPLLIMQRLNVNALYFERVGEKDFANQLGPVFDAYIEQHLRLLVGAQVHPELAYGSNLLTVDKFVVFPDVIVLVEIKATPMTAEGRAGLDRLDEDITRTITHGADQLQRTYDAIHSGRYPELAWVPTDRPFRGLVVTREPYWNAVNGFGSPLPTSFPTTVVSAREIEHLGAVGVDHDVAPALLSLTGVHSNSALAKALESYPENLRNPILEKAYHASLRFEDLTPYVPSLFASILLAP